MCCSVWGWSGVLPLWTRGAASLPELGQLGERLDLVSLLFPADPQDARTPPPTTLTEPGRAGQSPQEGPGRLSLPPILFDLCGCLQPLLPDCPCASFLLPLPTQTSSPLRLCQWPPCVWRGLEIRGLSFCLGLSYWVFSFPLVSEGLSPWAPTSRQLWGRLSAPPHQDRLHNPESEGLLKFYSPGTSPASP